VIHLNIRSLKEHYEDISQYIDDDHSGILCFSETKVYNYSKYRFHEVETVFQNRNNDKHGNVIYSTLSGSEKLLFQVDMIETVAVKTSNVIVVSVYIPPRQCFQHLLKDIEYLIKQVQETASQQHIPNIVVIGDFNLSFEQMNSTAELLKGYGLSQHVSKPTHQLGSVLDLAFTSVNNVTVSNIPVWFSHHHAVVLHFQSL
jgi:exonuclease III